MKQKLTILAKSEKHTGFCVAAVTESGKIIRLVRDAEGHALPEENCKFKKLDIVTISSIHAPLEYQKENHILHEVIERQPGAGTIEKYRCILQNPHQIFGSTDPWLTEDEMEKQSHTFQFIEVEELSIYENDEAKFKVDFVYNSHEYKGFSITDPQFKANKRIIKNAIILVSLPNAPFGRYGRDLYYKFVCAVYPISNTKSFDGFSSYII